MDKNVDAVKRMIALKAYKSFNNLQAGDMVKAYCEERGCKNFLKAQIINPSTMECIIQGEYFDMRNQTWFCGKHYYKKLNYGKG